MKAPIKIPFQCVHQTRGRIRIRVSWLRDRTARALPLERFIARAPHVRTVRVRSMTGIVIVDYDANEVAGLDLSGRLKDDMTSLPAGAWSAGLVADKRDTRRYRSDPGGVLRRGVFSVIALTGLFTPMMSGFAQVFHILAIAANSSRLLY